MNFKFSLPIDNIPFDEAKSLLKKVDILIVTVNKAEQESFLKFMLPVPETNTVISFVNNRLVYRIGRLGHFLVAYTQSGMGSAQRDGSTLTVYKAIETINPKIVLMPGVAFGVNKKKQKIGDVLVSRRVINYDVTRINHNKDDIQRGNDPICGQLLHNIFSTTIDWNHNLTKTSQSNIIVGEMLSGEKLVDDPEYSQLLKDKFPKAIGGEMEGTGVAAACGDGQISEWILVKGICDWADGKKNKTYQPKAALASMSLVFHILSIPSNFDDLKIFMYDRTTVDSEQNKYTLKAQKGTPLWTLNRLRSRVLSTLIKDLKAYTAEGYEEEICRAVRTDLNRLNTEIMRLPRVYKGNEELRGHFQDFIDTYLRWNEIQGSSYEAIKNRKNYRHKLKKIRKSISKVIRFSQKSLSYNLEESSTKKMISYQLELVRDFPDVFPNLKNAIFRISKKLKSIEVNID